ncbi:BTB/POZ domain [Fusarium oxysporum f. sp. vasinfectum]|nr:BTB/POZ domain [Fusarium oxysporum f. sp. vasinfectum]
MELVSNKAVATSKPFRFLIGPHQTEYTIHSSLVAHQSPALAAMVNEKSQESREYSVKWDDVDEMVFNSFWQFVYTGDYDTPEPLRPTRKTSGREDHKSAILESAAGEATQQHPGDVP